VGPGGSLPRLGAAPRPPPGPYRETPHLLPELETPPPDDREGGPLGWHLPADHPCPRAPAAGGCRLTEYKEPWKVEPTHPWLKGPITWAPVFLHQSHRWTQLCKKVGPSKFRFHDLRATFATRLDAHGVGAFTIKSLLGHSTLEVIKRYVGIDESSRRAVEQLANRHKNRHSTAEAI